MVFNWNLICICQTKMLKKWLWKVAMGTTAGRASQTALGSRGQCRDRGQQSRAHPKDPNKTQEHLKASHTKIRQVNLHKLKHRKQCDTDTFQLGKKLWTWEERRRCSWAPPSGQSQSESQGVYKKVMGSWDEGHNRLDLGYRLTAFQSERAITEIKVSYIEIVLVKWEGGKRKIWVRQTERKTFQNQQRNLEKPATFGPRVKHHQQLSYRQALLSRLPLWTRRSLREKKSDFNKFVQVALRFSSTLSECVGPCNAAA